MGDEGDSVTPAAGVDAAGMGISGL